MLVLCEIIYIDKAEQAMRLPKIQEDQPALKNVYFESIMAKPFKKWKGQKVTYDWQSAEVSLINHIPNEEDLLDNLVKLQRTCKQRNIPPFYSYFAVRKQLSKLNTHKQNEECIEIKAQIMKNLSELRVLIEESKSEYHKIMAVIRLRQSLLTEMQNSINRKSEQTYNSLDDLRFVNLQLIKAIDDWKKNNSVNEHKQAMFFKGERNYLLKMINDNSDIINGLNQRNPRFMIPPNPFFLSKDGNRKNMPETLQSQIQMCMEILAKEKAQELQTIINPPQFVSRTQGPEGLKNQLESDRMGTIKSIYNNKSKKILRHTNSSFRNTDSPASFKMKDHHMRSSSRDLSQSSKLAEKELEGRRNSRASPSNHSIEQSPTHKYQHKIQSLKQQIESNKVESRAATEAKAENLLKLSAYAPKTKPPEAFVPRTLTQIKTTKPKIRLVMEKETIVDDGAANNVVPGKTSGDMDLKPVTHSLRSSSANIFTKEQRLAILNKSTESKGNKRKKDSKGSKDSINNSARASKQGSGQKPMPGLKLARRKAVGSSINGLEQYASSKSSARSRGNIPTKMDRNESSYQQSQVESELRAVKSRLKELTIKKVYQNKQTASPIPHTKYSLANYQHANIDFKQSKSKEAEELKEHRIKKEELVNAMREKDRRIEQLLQELKLQEEAYEDSNSKYHDMKAEKFEKARYIMALRQKLAGSNRELKSRMEEQEQRYLQLKEQEYKIREHEISNKLFKEMQEMKQEFVRKNQELENKIIQEEKLRKEHERKLIEEKKQMEQLKVSLEEKRFKEQLLEEILEQQSQRHKTHEEIEAQHQQACKERIRKELLEFEAIERESVRVYEEQNKRLLQIVEQTKRRNEEAHQENQRKLAELLKIEEESKLQEQKLEILEKQVRDMGGGVDEESSQLPTGLQLPQNLEQEEQEEEAIKQRVKKEVLQEMQLRRKQQEEEMMQIEEDRNRRMKQIEEEFRSQLLKQERQIQQQEQLNSQATPRKDELEREQQSKNSQHDRLQQMIRQQHQQIVNQPETNEIEENQSKKLTIVEQMTKKDNVKDHQCQSQENQLANQTDLNHQRKNNEENQNSLNQENQLSHQKKQHQQHQIEHNTDQMHNSPTKGQFDSAKQQSRAAEQQSVLANQQVQSSKTLLEPVKEQPELEKKQSQRDKQSQLAKQQSELDKQSELGKKQSDPDNQQSELVNRNSEIDQQYKPANQSSQPVKSQSEQGKQSDKPANENLNAQSPLKKITMIQEDKKETLRQLQPVKKEQILKQSHIAKQSTEDILNKYQNLQRYLVKSKQIYLEEREVSEYLDTFYGQLGLQVKEILPYSRKDLEKLIMNPSKKVDIFDTSTIGWLERGANECKYNLIGSIGCLDRVIKKYGAIQIEMVYLFNRTKPSQKQFLAKQIKTFEQIGFFFQKKLQQQNMFSIKLIIKVPHEVVPKNFERPTTLFTVFDRLAMETHQHDGQNTNNCLNYLLSQTLRHCYEGKDSKESSTRLLLQGGNLPIFNDQNIQTNQIDETKIEMQIRLNLKYIQTSSHYYYVLKSSQYANRENQEIYISKYSDKISVIVCQAPPPHQELSLDMVLASRTQAIKYEMEQVVCVPIWTKSQTMKLNKPGCKSFAYAHSVPANLCFGSIFTATLHHQQVKSVKPPFVFAVYETGRSGQLLRPLYGQVVHQPDLINPKKRHMLK